MVVGEKDEEEKAENSGGNLGKIVGKTKASFNARYYLVRSLHSSGSRKGRKAVQQ